MKLDLKEWINKVTSLFSGMVVKQSFTTATKNFPSQGAQTFTINCAKTGYTPIGILQIQNNVGSTVNINGWWWSGDTLNVYMKNLTSSAVNNAYCLVQIAYIKTVVGGGST